MGEFFKGWRRKVGCAALMMACVYLAAWARGSVTLAGIPENADDAHLYQTIENRYMMGLCFTFTVVSAGLLLGKPRTQPSQASQSAPSKPTND